MADDAELQAEFQRGRRVGQREGLAFQGVPSIDNWLPGARFDFRDSWFDSFVNYERWVMLNLRLVQRMRWHLHHNRDDAKAVLSRRLQNDQRLGELELKIKDELWEARAAVDAELEEGRGNAAIVSALRALPQRPASVVEFPDVTAFVAEDPRRGIPGAAKASVQAGATFGFDWKLENPLRRWEVSIWRIDWLCDANRMLYSDDDWQEWNPAIDSDYTDELCACMVITDARGYELDTRVWLLGVLHRRAGAERALEDLRRHEVRDRNSLIAAAAAVAGESQREQGSCGQVPTHHPDSR